MAPNRRVLEIHEHFTPLPIKLVPPAFGVHLGMSAPGSHCPFLNRSDARCVENFSMARLNHALEYCVGSYTACPVYIELLVERRSKRAAAAEQNWRDGKRVVQISVHGRNVERHAADLATAPVAPGV